MSFSSRDSETPAVNATRARQGRWGRPILWVLVFGTLLAALGMFAAWNWRSAEEGPPGPAQELVSGKGFGAPEPPPPNPQNP
jgi:hypothetical protein